MEQAAAPAALAPDPDRAPAVPVHGADLRAVEGANTGPVAKFHPTPFAIGLGEAASARVLEDAKLAALAEFAAGAGHEINNPLATIVGRARRCSSTRPIPVGGRAWRRSPRRRFASAT